MKYATALFFLLPFFLTAQDSTSSAFEIIDEHARALERGDADLETFTKASLLKHATTDIEKARSIFIWIIDNIAYDCRKFHTRKPTMYTYASAEEKEEKLAAIKQKNLTTTVDRERGICSDYAQLFAVMCTFAGVEAVAVEGYARIATERRTFKRPGANNHAWSAFKSDGQWHLVDATWGAGYVNPEVTRFRKKNREEFFMMEPRDLVKTHYPEDPAWQLLDMPLDEAAFADQPLLFATYWELGGVKLEPANGKLKGSPITLTLTLNKEDVDPKRLFVFQGDKPRQQGFTRNGTVYSATFTSKSNKNVILYYREGNTKFVPVAMFKP